MTNATAKDVPAGAILEHYILQAAFEKGMLDESSAEVRKHFGMGEGPSAPSWQIRILTLLYCLLVFPREIWHQDGALDRVVSELNSDAEIPDKLRDLCNLDVLRHLRNATAHAHIEFIDCSIKLWDGKFFRELSYQDAAFFLIHLGRAFHHSRPEVRASFLARNQ